MIHYINLSKSVIRPLPYLNDEEYQAKFNKGWSYSFVYHFSEIRNIFILVRKFGFTDLKTFTRVCLANNLPAEKTTWNERRILEHLNALKNFGLLTDDYRVARQDIFQNKDLLSPITDSDLSFFEEIFFSYYRFKEVLSWFVDPDFANRDEIINSLSKEVIMSSSSSLFPFSTQSRFTDSFIFHLTDNTPVYRVEKKFKSNEDVMRFWDVFIKWASMLNLIEKFNLKNLDFQLAENYRSLSCVYFKQPVEPSFNILTFIKENYNSSYINIPKLIFKIATNFRYSIDDIKDLIIKASKENNNKISLQRTSEIFIRNTEINFVPKVNDSYISHLLIN
jgi:hypothetical protein